MLACSQIAGIESFLTQHVCCTRAWHIVSRIRLVKTCRTVITKKVPLFRFPKEGPQGNAKIGPSSGAPLIYPRCSFNVFRALNSLENTSSHSKIKGIFFEKVKTCRMVPYCYPAYGIPAVCRMPFTKLRYG